MPMLGANQDTGRVIRWIKPEGASVVKGEPLMEIETDKVTVEIEAPATGTLANITAKQGLAIPVGQTIAVILAAGEVPFTRNQPGSKNTLGISASPLARRIAEEQGVDLALVKAPGGRIEKADVLAFIENQRSLASQSVENTTAQTGASQQDSRPHAAAGGVDLATPRGTGPEGTLLPAETPAPVRLSEPPTEEMPRVWRVMAERMTQSWTSVPHFYLAREVAAQGLVQMRAQIEPVVKHRSGVKPTYTDILVKIVAMGLRDHPRANASWIEGNIQFNSGINIGIATAIDSGLVVPVIHDADVLGIGEIAMRRRELVERANEGKLRPADITGGTFTLTNLGMHKVDSFDAIINPPEVAILAVGRITDRVVAIDGQPAVRPRMQLVLSCDHRALDGARGAKFLDDLVMLIEEPWRLLAWQQSQERR